MFLVVDYLNKIYIIHIYNNLLYFISGYYNIFRYM